MVNQDQAKLNDQVFFKLLPLAFLLEGSGYLVIPYLALHLREFYQLSEVTIGFYFMVSLWLRPVWSLGASFMARNYSARHLIQVGALVSGVSICGLFLSKNAVVALGCVILANLGLSIWNPSIYAFTYDLFGNKESTKAKVSRLNFATYIGAAVGAGTASMLAATHRNLIFILAAGLFLAVSFISRVLTNDTHLKHQTIENKKNVLNVFSWNLFSSLELVLLSICSISYWASYSQFNSFFSLLISDHLKKPEIVGISFSVLTIVVALLSLSISKFKILQKLDIKILLVSLLLLGPCWMLLIQQPTLFSTWIFLIILAISEAFFVLVLAHLWARLDEGRAHFMQSLNFSLCNIGMGLGAITGGFFYKADISESLIGFGAENLIFTWLSAFALFSFYFWSRKNGKMQFSDCFFEKHEMSNLKIFLFEKNILKENLRLSKRIIEYCEKIQDQVWTKKFKIEHNSVGQDILLLAWDEEENIPVGFFSASFKSNSKHAVYIYHSDAMILQSHRGIGLLRHFIEIVNRIAFDRYRNKDIINIVASGYIHAFSVFQKVGSFKLIPMPYSQSIENDLPQILMEDFNGLCMDGNGVIKSAWSKQVNQMADVWPDSFAELYGFPKDVNYFAGDILVKLYYYHPTL